MSVLVDERFSTQLKIVYQNSAVLNMSKNVSLMKQYFFQD